eukprot:TRINITY_DN113945_c0_g1_i1.p1 TRINITY_DN113945_c0_g1~~TRINITY_DN113945_c0_g1_i1.p1  ORF type:complete len:316 (+),score=45.46 TRINITY_DN113945_c0_g1_i1:119-1066(+)
MMVTPLLQAAGRSSRGLINAAAVLAAVAVAVTEARFLHRSDAAIDLRHAENRTIGLLAAGSGKAATTDEDNPLDTVLPADFFSEDMEPSESYPAGPPRKPGDPLCDPSCTWECGSQSCDQACEPVCAPPACMTLCRKSVQKCETRCGPPRCAVICPQSDCKKGKCGTCRTACSPPLCTTECSEECHSHCAKPACNWQCKNPVSCPKPKCKLKCAGAAKCAVAFRPVNSSSHKVPQFQNRKIVAQSAASLDPAVLFDPMTPPPPFEVTTAPPHAAVTTTTKPTTMTPMGPVAELKSKWASQDARRRGGDPELLGAS